MGGELLHLGCYSDPLAVGAFDAVTRTVVLLGTREERSSALSKLPLAGTFDLLGGTVVILFRFGGSLTLDIGGSIREPLKELTVEWTRGGSYSRLEIWRMDTSLSILEYVVPTLNPPLQLDPTPGVDEEDWDFGLFIFNVSADLARQERLYR